MTAISALPHIDARSYVPHELHRGERAWGESNCYIDVWIEVLSALGCDPHACLPFVLAIDWEGDQFTFFKPPHEDLFALYGVDVQELTVYKPLAVNAREQLKQGKIVLSEIDAYYLPDTAGTDYRTQHTKTTIGIQEIDLEARVLGYFHNSSYHALRDADFVGLFRLDAAPDSTFMPFFAELVRTKYHTYAFATIRQLGAAFELGAVYLRWLERNGERDLEPSARAFDAISATAKSLILKTARAVGAKKDVDLSPMLREIEAQWAAGMRHLSKRHGV
jgi:hypothetical protein